MEQATPIQTNSLSTSVISPPLRYCLYSRKSTESDELQALSIESQIKEMLQIAEREGLNVVEIREESHSAKAVGQRPVFNQLVEDIKGGKFDAILSWHADRLARNAGDLASLIDLMDQKILKGIRTYSQKFTNSPNEKFLFMILGSQAKLENDNKSVNVKRGLRALVEKGLWISTAPTGYLNEKRVGKRGHVLVDPRRAQIVKEMFEKVAYQGWSGRKLYIWLNGELKFKTRNNKSLSLSNIYLILKNSFYYGVFEYPKGGGSWYTGKHKPLITKELFDKVQERITRDKIVRTENKEFAFTRLLKCGHCGSGISADEKFRKLKDGSFNRHVYYICAKSRDINCKCKPTTEADLVNQLIKLMDEINLDKVGIKEKIGKEVERFHKFQQSVLGINKPEVKQKEVDIRNYAKYILKQGTIPEKRELLSCLKSKLILKNKQIYLEK